jgi:fermentation-respiration switch protein FrsA (DUF1100 family)
MEPATEIQFEEEAPSGRTGRTRRVALITAGAIAVLYVAIGWYISDEILGGLRVDQWATESNIDIVELSNDTITLAVPDSDVRDADRDAVLGLRWEGGYGQVGAATSFEGNAEIRPFTLLGGAQPALGTDVASFDAFAFLSDPAVLGIEFETVTYRGPLGDLEAWLVPGDGSTWIVAVHGLGADRTEFLRFLSATDDLNYPTLVVRYRNDEGAPIANDLKILAGQEEWEDVAAAVDYALVNGASDVVIYGASMGGALTLGYAYNTSQDTIRALILESPVADMREVIQLRSGEALPIGGFIGDSMLSVGRGVAWLRTGLDFDTVDYVDRADELAVPVLLLHGRADTTIPFAVGESLAEARPDQVEFHPVDGAAHVRAWNEDPEQYAATVGAFLERVGRSD